MATYYHYTSRESAQNIACGGKIIPGLSGRVFLTVCRYAIGHVAANELAIYGKAVEFGVEIDGVHVTNASRPRPAIPYQDQTGKVVRAGGGLELTAKQDIQISSSNKWFPLDIP